MTISSQDRKAGPYIGAGTTTSFTFAFKVFAATDLLVVQTDTELGTESTLVLNTDYTVSLNPDQNANPGGSVVLASVLAIGFNLTITSSLEYLQPTDLTNQGGFYPSVITNALDRLTIFCQQLADAADRSLKVAVSTPGGVTTTLPVPVANKLIQWNTTATGLQNADPASLATLVAYGTAQADVFVGDGAWTSKPLTYSPGALYNLDVSISGGTQEHTRDFTWDSTNNLIVFTSPPPSGARVLVRYMQGLPNSITNASAVAFAPAGGTGTDVQTVLREYLPSVKRFGAKGDGVTDDSTAIAAADLWCYNNGVGKLYFPPGKYRCTQKITKQKRVGWFGDLNPTEAQTPADWTTALVCDGPTGGDFINLGGLASEDGNVEIHHLGFYTAGASIDAINCFTATPKCVDVHHCSILNFSVGVKTNGAVCKVYSNHINSCGIMIDCAGGESAVYDNHGYPETLGILIRGSNTKVYGNKVYGDGASAPYGIQVWGYGNLITGNVCDAFTDIGIYVFSNNTAPYTAGNPACDQNIIANNSVSAIGNGGGFSTAIVVHAKNGDISGNVVQGNTIYNKRGDRTMVYGVMILADAGRINDKTYALGNTIANTTTKAVLVSGAGTKSNYRIKNNPGYITENSGTISGYNALIVNHGLDATPTHVDVNAQSNTIYAAGADSFTSTTFRLLLRDNTGTVVPSGSPVSCTWRAVVD